MVLGFEGERAQEGFVNGSFNLLNNSGWCSFVSKTTQVDFLKSQMFRLIYILGIRILAIYLPHPSIPGDQFSFGTGTRVGTFPSLCQLVPFRCSTDGIMCWQHLIKTVIRSTFKFSRCLLFHTLNMQSLKYYFNFWLSKAVYHNV